MKSANVFAVILVTAPNIKAARALAQASLTARLAACANLLPNLESHYWWNGKIERSFEFLILFKARRRDLPALEKLILAHHPNDTPEFIVLHPASGSRKYLQWILDSTKTP